MVYCCATLVFTLFLLITKSLFPILPHIIRHSRMLIYSFWAHNEKVAKAAKNPTSNVIFSQKNSKREKITFQSLHSLMLDFAEKMFEKLLISAFSSPLNSKNLKYEIQAQKARKSERNRKKNLMKMRCSVNHFVSWFWFHLLMLAKVSKKNCRSSFGKKKNVLDQASSFLPMQCDKEPSQFFLSRLLET